MDYPDLNIIVPPIDTKNEINISENKMVKITSKFLRDHLAIRDSGDAFSSRSIFLSEDFDWVLGNDHHGALVLVPLNK